MRKRILPGLMLALAALAGCTTENMGLPGVSSAVPTARPDTETASTTEKHGKLDRLIAAYSAAYQVPASLIHRVVRRESNYNPSAYHAGNYGLMQIRYRTARGMGYKGKPHGLLDADTNLKYAVRYLKGAWLVAGGDEKRADRLYRTGYYYDAKRKGMLDEVGWTRLAATGEQETGSVAAAEPVVTAAAADKEVPARETASTAVVAAAQPDTARFGPAVATAAPASEAPRALAVGYAGPTPSGQAMPAVMTAPPSRPSL